MTESKAELIRLVSDEMRAHHNDQELMDQAVMDHVGINRTDMRCLDILDQTHPMTAGELATATGLTTGAVTAVIDRMERAGFVKRLRDPDDRRKVLVELTDVTRRIGEDLYGELAEAGAEHLSGYTLAELRVLHRFLARSREINREQAAWVRSLPRQDRSQ